MKKANVFLASLSTVFLSACGLMKGLENDLTVSVRVKGELYFSGVVNSFNNVILPKMDASYVESGMKFAGYTINSRWTIDDGVDALYKEGALIRYQDIKQYSYNGNVELFSQFVDEDTDLSEKHYLVLGWYNKPQTSGLNTTIIKKLTTNLTSFLIENGATKDELNDFIVKGYEGNVETIGAAINEDGYVDVFIGGGNNLNTKGGVTKFVEKKAASQDYGEATNRYVFLLKEKPIARLVYEYCDSEAFYSIFE